MLKEIDITINGRKLRLIDGDEVDIENFECGRCESTHTKMVVTRSGKEIAKLGDGFTLYGEDELYGGIIVDDNGKPLPNPHWIIHIVPNDKRAMTKDKRHYVGLCGKILDDKVNDRMTFISEVRFINTKDRERICPKCLKAK